MLSRHVRNIGAQLSSFPRNNGVLQQQSTRRCLSTQQPLYLRRSTGLGKFNEPLSGMEMPRAGGIATMMRLPYQKTAEGNRYFLFLYLISLICIASLIDCYYSKVWYYYYCCLFYKYQHKTWWSRWCEWHESWCGRVSQTTESARDYHGDRWIKVVSPSNWVKLA